MALNFETPNPGRIVTVSYAFVRGSGYRFICRHHDASDGTTSYTWESVKGPALNAEELKKYGLAEPDAANQHGI